MEGIVEMMKDCLSTQMSNNGGKKTYTSHEYQNRKTLGGSSLSLGSFQVDESL